MEPSKIVKVGGAEYSIGRLDMFQALNAARLASPALPVLFSGVIEGFLKMWQERGADEKTEDFASELVMALTVAQPLFDRVAAMPKKDFDELVSTCLSCCRKRRGKEFSPVMHDGVPFDDLAPGDALVLTLQVLVREIRPIGAALFGMASEQKA